ncbi:MAG: caspase family protein, partial [Planctomycetaceae bacterium]|nr:caspase family protein [Planctomycetaceae bacterium]
MLTGSWELTATIWDAQTGRELRTLKGHSAAVNSVSFSPDGKFVLTGSKDGTSKIWDVETGQELLTLVSFKESEDWLVYTPEGLFDGSAAAREKVCYRVGGGLNVVPVDRFFRSCYRPGLLKEIFEGKRPKPDADYFKANPPVVKIVSPEEGTNTTTPRVTIVAEATDQGGGVLTPWLKHNGIPVEVDALPQRIGNRVRREFPIALVAGENQIEVVSATSDGNWESEPARITITYNRSIEKPELYLLAVGIGDYKEDALDLQFPAKDAKAIAKLFEERSQGLYEKTHITTLTDEDATKGAIREALRKIQEQAKAEDVVVLFLAGHGKVIHTRYRFLTADFTRSETGTFESDVRSHSLPDDELAELVGGVKA